MNVLRAAARGFVPRRISLRNRLTLLFGGLFLIGGGLLLGTTYVLFQQGLEEPGTLIGMTVPPVGAESTGARGPLPPAEAEEMLVRFATEWQEEEQERLRENASTSLLTRGGVALLVVGGAATVLGWLVAGRVLRPLRRVTDTARRIAAVPAADRGLHERIDMTGPEGEVRDLAVAFDTMVERLDRSFDGQRRFVANASHELRTPLTLSRALVELAVNRATASEDVRRLGEDLLAINARHERLITGLLLLAGSENEIPERRPVDMADIVSHVVAQVAPEAERAGVSVEEDAAEAPTLGDALLLERLVSNLVENGVRHNRADGGRVRVTSRVVADDDVAEVVVDNTGPVVPLYEVPALFEPFRRLGADRLVTAKGAGLGLSIVRSVARAHGGDVVARPREDGGLTVTVRLPLSHEHSGRES
ncbi:sensor histidine kinase [Nocardiopsis sp. NPDC050513]|uniref:sensor histidine kinase n=1 Tax=Nocardiopsis sp. NPDC050513 TaxID=3364338 RepID=UPI0037AB3FE3